MINHVRIPRISAAVLALAAAAHGLAMNVPYDYFVPLTPENAILGHFSSTKKPVLVVKSGAVVKINGGGGNGRGDDPVKFLNDNHIPITEETLTCMKESAAVREQTPKLSGPGFGHLMVGPIYIEDAEPGDSLEIRILDVTPRLTFGNTGSAPGRGGLALGSPLPPENRNRGATPALSVPRPSGHITILDVKRNVGIFSNGIEVPLKPFMGVMATCPPDSEGPDRSSTAPGAFGGNLDCSELTTGSTLYLPVFQKGALFYTGDSHALQGDGEVTGTAIETADACTLQFILHKGKTLKMPRAENADYYISFGLNPDLNLAMKQSIEESISFLKETRGMDIIQAYPLCSIAVSYRVTQVVDRTLGVHGMLAKRIFINEPNTYWYRPVPPAT